VVTVGLAVLAQGFGVGHGGGGPVQELAEPVHFEPVGQTVLVVVRVLAAEQGRGVTKIGAPVPQELRRQAGDRVGLAERAVGDCLAVA
jgi:hypothetical protein